MKHSSITFISILLTFFLLSNSFLCPSLKEDETAPVVEFTIEPEGGNIQTNFKFDASGSHDDKDPVDQLVVEWCFNYVGFDDHFSGKSHDKICYHSYEEPGTYNVECRVYDSHGNEGWATKSLIVTQEGSAPHASFSVFPLQGTLQTIFSFDASGSTDNETPADQLEVRWDWNSDGTYDTEFSTVKEAQHQFTETGLQKVTLQVKDTDGTTDQASKDVQVNTGTPPVASFTISPEGGNTLTTFTFDASASSDLETPQSDLVVVWDFENDGIWDTEPTNYKIAYHQYSSEGHHEIKLWVRDTDFLDDYQTKTLEVNNCIDGGEPCQGIPTVSYEGYVYHTVQIGDQCWLKENLNVGNRIDHGTSQTDNQLIEKYCYDDQESYCDLYGGLYQWYEMMNYTEVSGTQGICPPGWHIPTESEFDVLAETLGGMLVAGSKMKACTDDWQFHYQVNSNESGFTGLPAGYYASSGSSFVSQGQRTRYFGSFYYTYARQLSYDGSSFGKVGAMPLGEALSVRCIKDSK
jgi:uncharacterized protein (TIGR02145 family)